MSRVEGILDGTYTGPPLSRVEQLLKNSGGGGNTDLTGVYAEIQTVKDSVASNTLHIQNIDQDISDLGKSVMSISETVDESTKTIGELKTHALTDAPIE